MTAQAVSCCLTPFSHRSNPLSTCLSTFPSFSTFLRPFSGICITLHVNAAWSCLVLSCLDVGGLELKSGRAKAAAAASTEAAAASASGEQLRKALRTGYTSGGGGQQTGASFGGEAWRPRGSSEADLSLSPAATSSRGGGGAKAILQRESREYLSSSSPSPRTALAAWNATPSAGGGGGGGGGGTSPAGGGRSARGRRQQRERAAASGGGGGSGRGHHGGGGGGGAGGGKVGTDAAEEDGVVRCTFHVWIG